MAKVTTTDGRVLGQRAHETRRRLLDATALLLAEQGAFDLKVIDVARAVGSSPATFYQYFEDVDAALLALAAEAGGDMAALMPQLREPWDRQHGLEVVRRFVTGFLDYWDGHKAVLRLRNLRAEEGDTRFRQSRLQATSPLLELFMVKIDDAKAAGRVAQELNSYATAGAMIAVLERLVAFHVEFQRRGVSQVDMIETIARILYDNLTGYRDMPHLVAT
jgi:AcrR family transcriptional regulator